MAKIVRDGCKRPQQKEETLTREESRRLEVVVVLNRRGYYTENGNYIVGEALIPGDAVSLYNSSPGSYDYLVLVETANTNPADVFIDVAGRKYITVRYKGRPTFDSSGWTSTDIPLDIVERITIRATFSVLITIQP